jgi:hypothetical protein
MFEIATPPPPIRPMWRHVHGSCTAAGTMIDTNAMSREQLLLLLELRRQCQRSTGKPQDHQHDDESLLVAFHRPSKTRPTPRR